MEQLGTATSNLTFFQSVGGTVGLAITGTIFASAFSEQLPLQLSDPSIPPAAGATLGAALANGSIDSSVFTRVGDLGHAILGSLPADAQAQVAPFIDAIVAAIYRASPSPRPTRSRSAS